MISADVATEKSVMMSAGVWQEAKHTDGRIYYWNTQTKETRWTKPDSGDNAQDNSTQAWKEYLTPDGRKYYHNSVTKATVWEKPQEYSETSQTHSAPTSSHIFNPDGTSSTTQPTLDRERDAPNTLDRDRVDYHRDNSREGVRNNFISASSSEREYHTLEEAEAAFFKLLKRADIRHDTPWEQALRTIIKEPQFRALKDPKERRNAFEKYVIDVKAQEKEREKERVAKLRQDFGTMLKSQPDIKHNTRWKTARPMIEAETIYRSALDDEERRQFFEEYMARERKAYAQSISAHRKAAREGLGVILKSLEFGPYTRWSDARFMIDANENFQNDIKFKYLQKSDILTAFEQHVKSLERLFNDTRQTDKNNRGRRERWNRDKYLDLLHERRADRTIQAGKKWMHFVPLIQSDERYTAILGQTGSTPIDLFWDIVEDEERILRGKRNEVLDVLDDSQYEVTTKTTWPEFVTVMNRDTRTKNMDSADMQLIYERLYEKIVRRSEEEKYYIERSQRRLVDALRSRIKHLEPPVKATDSWDADVRPRVEKSEEYRAIDDKQLHRLAFDKVIRRLKEKDPDTDPDRNRRLERDHDSRSNGTRRARDGISHSPEPDVYEAERRKAMAARERQYRKSSVIGLSPPPSESPRRRDWHDDKYETGKYSVAGFERERRRGQTERERSYTSRIATRNGQAKELDYGESGRAGSMSGNTNGRRRRDSESDNDNYQERGPKRPRREEPDQNLSATHSTKQEEALKSGSEEGEIEEL